MAGKRFRSARTSPWNYLGQRENASSQTNCTRMNSVLHSRVSVQLTLLAEGEEGDDGGVELNPGSLVEAAVRCRRISPSFR